MASYSRASGVGGRVVVLFLIDLAILLGGLIWFDSLGIVDMKWLFNPIYSTFGLEPRNAPALAPESPILLDGERLVKQREALDIRAEELQKLTDDLAKQEADLAQRSQALDEQEKALSERENSFNQTVQAYDNRMRNIAQLAKYLVGQPPASAVKQLMAYTDDQLIIDICREVETQAQAAGETSIVSYWFTLMPEARAATIQRKMAEKPQPLASGQ